ncbi:MAG: hypothetical protein KIS66_17590 [Fimbriimonadaceae bacterium]|nr:hypothetical protein [Fimbriimonadaceae bacterium]
MAALYVIRGPRMYLPREAEYLLGRTRPIACFIPVAMALSLAAMVLSDKLSLRAIGLANMGAQLLCLFAWTSRRESGAMLRVVALDSSKTTNDVLWCSDLLDEYRRNVVFYLLEHERVQLAMDVPPTHPLRTAKDLNGRRPFMVAAFLGLEGFVDQEGVHDLTVVEDRQGYRVGHYAAAGEHAGVLLLLARKGVDPNPVNLRNGVKATELWPEFDWGLVRTDEGADERVPTGSK